jgi:hypothetical protein
MKHRYCVLPLKRFTGFYKPILWAILLLCINLSHAQNLDKLKDLSLKKGIKLNGGLNINTVYNAPTALNAQPISYFASGTLNFNVFGYNVPINLNYSNRKFNYSQPFSFNYASINPSYKWVSANIGTTFKTFSPYSLNGHQFQGLGLALTPKHWNVSMMYGQLLKAQNGDYTANQKVLATYKRMGMGMKTVYKNDKMMAGITLFHADDVVNSLSLLPSQLSNPLQNMVVGLELGTTLFKKLQLQADYTTSAIIENKNNAELKKTSSPSIAGVFLPKNPSTVAYHAFKVGANYNLSKTQTLLGVSYQRVDPNYRTLGAYYFVNDFQNLTANLSQSLMGGKLSVAANAGVQNDDLANKKGTKQKRFVGMINLNATPSDKLTIGFNFSNFTSYTYIRTAFDEIRKLNPFEQLDTLNYKQISQNISSSISYTLSKSETKNQALGLNVAFMESANLQGDVVRQGGESGFINGTATYSLQYPKRMFGINTGLNTSINTIGLANTSSVGPVLSVQKGFLKNTLGTNLSVSYIHSTLSQYSTQADAFNLRLNGKYQLYKKHTLHSNFGYTQSTATNTASRNFVSLTFGYGLIF